MRLSIASSPLCIDVFWKGGFGHHDLIILENAKFIIAAGGPDKIARKDRQPRKEQQVGLDEQQGVIPSLSSTTKLGLNPGFQAVSNSFTFFRQTHLYLSYSEFVENPHRFCLYLMKFCVILLTEGTFCPLTWFLRKSIHYGGTFHKHASFRAPWYTSD